MKYGWWTYIEMDRCKGLHKEGKTIEEIALELDRTENSIKNLLETERVLI